MTVGRSAHETARRHAKKDQVTPQDVPQLFRWLGEGGPTALGPHGEPTTPQFTWEELKQSIHQRLKTKQWSARLMRQDTKRLAKIESVTQKLVEALELGATLDIAAAYAGIKPVEFREWLALGHARPRSIYAAFLTLIQEAVAKCDVADLQVVSKAAASGEWKASIERLKLRGYGAQSAPEKKPINVKIVNYNFNQPALKQTAQIIDLDTLEPVQEEPRAITEGEESEDLSEQCSDVDARGPRKEASPGDLVLGISEGETPSENRQEEPIKG